MNLSRFSLFFPEKRQFFTESAGIFDFGRSGVGFTGGDSGGGGGPGLLSVFYSRRIGLNDGREVPILGGGKVTGKVGSYSVGLMNIETDRTSGGLDVPRANYSVLRVKRNVFAQSTVGGILLNRQGGGGSAFNRTAGFDLGLNFGSATQVVALVARTFTPGQTGRDMASALGFSWKSDKFNYGATYLDIGERFSAEMGFIPRIDIRNTQARAAWTPRPRWPGVRQLTMGAAVSYFENHAGQTESRNQGLDFTLMKHDSSSLRVGLDRDYDLLPADWTTGAGTIPAGGYGWQRMSARWNSNQSRPVSGNAGFDVGGYYNGDRTTFTAGLNLVPKDTLLVEANYTRNVFSLPGFDGYTTNTVNTRVSYSFSPDLFLKSFIQYNDDRRLASFNFLFWYIYRPGSDLYVVYDGGWETDVPGDRYRWHLRPRNRSLAIKMTYWLAR